VPLLTCDACSFAEKDDGRIVVGNVTKSGNADLNSVKVNVGDHVLAVTGRELVRCLWCTAVTAFT
jgi:hypothetical protein